MSLVEMGGWLFVSLDVAERNPDLDWNGLIEWKIPGEESVYVAGLDLWIVSGRYRRLLEDLYFIYRTIGESDLDSAAFIQAQKMLDEMEQWIPEQESRTEDDGQAIGPYEFGLN